MEKKVHWHEPKLDLVITFKEENFSKLNEYAKENILELMSIWLNEDIEASRKTLKLASSLLNYFEHFLEDTDEKSFAAFKLGEALGHVNCLNRICYEDQEDILIMQRYVFAKSVLSEFNELMLKSILRLICNKQDVSLSELSKQFYLSSKDFEKILSTFELCGFINSYKSIMDVYYSLTDGGRRLVNQLEN